MKPSPAANASSFVSGRSAAHRASVGSPDRSTSDTKKEINMIGTVSEQAVISDDGTRIAYTTTGTGPGLVILSGGLLSGKDYAALASALAGTFTVHSVDRRGRGDSGPQGENHSMAAEVTDLCAVLAATGARFVFGHSYGGLVALQAALRTTGEIERVAAYEPAVSVDGSLPTDYLPEFDKALEEGRKARAMAILLRGLKLAGPMADWPMPVTVAASEVMLRTVGRSFRAALPAIAADARAGIDCDGPATAYATMPVPAMLMIGEHGPDYLREAVTAVSAATPSARLIEVPGTGHDAPQQIPETIAAEMRAFFA
jgi:pimeloyl-ACP methyl ester carboxylesterase